MRSVVLICIPSPPPYSGEETLGLTLQSALESLPKPYDVSYFDVGNKQSNAKRGRLNFANIWATLRIIFGFLLVVVRKKPYGIYLPLAANTFGFIKYGILIQIASFFRARIVACFGGANFHHFFARSSPRFQKWIRSVLRKITILIVQGKAMKSQFEGIIDFNKIKVVQLGIDPRPFQKKQRNLIPKNIIHVLFVGCISKAKGSFDLLESVPFVIQKGLSVHFHFVGEILEREQNIIHVDNPSNNREAFFGILKKNQIEQYVTLHGVLFGNAKVALYEQADIFVLPSYSESFPYVLLEAAASGLAIITTSVGSNPEVYEEAKNAFFVEIGNPKMLASKIVELVENSTLRQAMGKNNQELILKNHTHLHFGNRINEIFCGLI